MDTPIETYEQALQFLYGRINYERLHSESYTAQDLKLDRMRWLLNLIGNPQNTLPAVHVAGTKGKGSTCAMVASILTAAGWRTGLYISPHISAFEERMTVDGRRPTQGELIQLVHQVREPVAEMDRLPQRMPPTYFEIATALAWQYFLREHVQIAVLETGLGGRLDSTNVCQPWATCITNISRDHTHLLGDTLRQIATEKAGIIKPGVPVVSGVTQPETIEVIERISRSHDAPCWLLGRDIVIDQTRRVAHGQHFHWQIDVRTPRSEFRSIQVPLLGRHQIENTALALALVDRLRLADLSINDDAIHAGLSRVEWPARVEVLGTAPAVVVDAAHNWASAKALVTALQDEFPDRRRILVFASTRDKDVSGQLRLLLPHFETLILTQYVDNPRAVPPAELRQLVETLSGRPAHVTHDPVSAWMLTRRLAEPSDLIVVTGSFFLVAELRELILQHTSEAAVDVSAVPSSDRV